MDNGLVFFKIFEPFKKDLLAFSTTKKALNHATPRFTGDSPEVYQRSRENLAKILDIQHNQLVFPRQTHTNCVVDIDDVLKTEISETDALVTKKQGICLCVQTADCVPILLFDPVKRVISAIHSGWRGTIKKIVEVAVLKMKDIYGSSPENILALIGPSIGPGVYEVGDEVVKKARENIPNAENTLHENLKGTFHFNLWEANQQLLLNIGLRGKNIEIAGECSFIEDKKYFSARREGVNTGRIVSGIMLL